MRKFFEHYREFRAYGFGVLGALQEAMIYTKAGY